MKAVRKSIVLLSLGMLGVGATSASVVEQTYLDTCRKEPGVPVPIAVVSPVISSEYAGSTVDVEFTVDRTGMPAKFSIKSETDDVLAGAVVGAVKQWKFKPAERNGTPVDAKVVLPVKVLDPYAGPLVAAK